MPPIKKEPYNPERLQDVVDRLQSVAATLNTVAGKMRARKIESLTIGPKVITQTLSQIENFASNAARELDAAQACPLRQKGN